MAIIFGAEKRSAVTVLGLITTIVAYPKYLELTKNRYAASMASRADVLQAQPQLKTAEAQMIDIGVQRAQLEHAVALLIGKPASNFSIPVSPLLSPPPHIPVVMPSELLERRPNIASALQLIKALGGGMEFGRSSVTPSALSGRTA